MGKKFKHYYRYEWTLVYLFSFFALQFSGKIAYKNEHNNQIDHPEANQHNFTL